MLLARSRGYHHPTQLNASQSYLWGFLLDLLSCSRRYLHCGLRDSSQPLCSFGIFIMYTYKGFQVPQKFSEVYWGACSPSLISDTHLRPRHIGSLRSLLTKLRLVLSQSKPRLKLCRWLGGNVQKIHIPYFKQSHPLSQRLLHWGFWEFPSYAVHSLRGILSFFIAINLWSGKESNLTQPMDTTQYPF